MTQFKFVEDMNNKCKEIIRKGVIMTNVEIPSEHTRLLNVKCNDTTYFIRKMDDNFMTLQDLSKDIPVTTVYRKTTVDEIKTSLAKYAEDNHIDLLQFLNDITPFFYITKIYPTATIDVVTKAILELVDEYLH